VIVLLKTFRITPWLLWLCSTAGAAAPLSTPHATTSDHERSLTGAYRSSSEHPRVFTTPVDVEGLVARINAAGSFSAEIFPKLAKRVKADLAAKQDWGATYSGCDLDIYLHAFSYEPVGGYANEIRSESQLRIAMGMKQDALAPTGAAVVASRLALYAALVNAGAHAPIGAPSADQAADLSKRILLAWATRGFRDQQGKMLHAAEQFCDGQRRFSRLEENGVGLQIGRGVVYSVHAQDLLQAIGALKSEETRELNAVHAALFDLILEASNFRFALPELNHPDTVCELYSNHVGAHLAALLSIARLLDDNRKLTAVLYGNDRSIPVALPWARWFNRAIYGQNDKPIPCYKNPGPDSLTSHPSFQTSVAAPGEIEDRYRNANAGQAFGYSLGVLAALYNMAELLSNAGFDAYGYRGVHQQSIEMATEYYACFGKQVGFKKTVSGENGRRCPDYLQYVGQIVGGLEINIVMGAHRFPGNRAIAELELAAKAAAGPDLLDPIRFGRWNN
jgi:hypothetical protein